MKTASNIYLNGSVEQIETQLERDLGMSPGGLDRIRRVFNSVSALKQRQQEDEQRALDRMFAGKTGAERVALVKANKARIRKFLGSSATSADSRDASAKPAAKATARTVRRRLK